MVKIPFTKMHGIGNDFIVINQMNAKYNLTKNTIQNLSNRHTGIGFDQLLIVEESSNTKADFKYRIFNKDGAEVEQCGNGARCFLHYVYSKGLTDKKVVKVETVKGNISLTEKEDGAIEVNMGNPNFNLTDIPYVSVNETIPSVIINGKKHSINLVSMGNPHAVIKIDNFENIDIPSIAHKLQNSKSFPKGVNVGFLKVISKKQLRLKVYERGSGLTLACGSGACAAAVIAIRNSWTINPVHVAMDGGELRIEWQHEQPVLMTGPAQIVYEGFIELDD